MKIRNEKGKFVKNLDLYKVCEVCGKEYYCRSLWKYQTSRYCSKDCLGKHNSIIRKGITQYVMTDSTRKAISEAKKGVSIFPNGRGIMEWMIGENNHKWKDKPSYRTMHRWVETHKGKASYCEECGMNEKNIKYQWANKDHKYLRVLDDYKSMCPKCHYKYDKLVNGSKKGSKTKEEI